MLTRDWATEWSTVNCSTLPADEISPAVAETGHVNLAVLLDGDHGGRPHAAAERLAHAGLHDGLVRLGQRLANGGGGVLRGSKPFAQHARNDLGGQAAGDFAAPWPPMPSATINKRRSASANRLSSLFGRTPCAERLPTRIRMSPM